VVVAPRKERQAGLDTKDRKHAVDLAYLALKEGNRLCKKGFPNFILFDGLCVYVYVCVCVCVWFFVS